MNDFITSRGIRHKTNNGSWLINDLFNFYRDMQHALNKMFTDA